MISFGQLNANRLAGGANAYSPFGGVNTQAQGVNAHKPDENSVQNKNFSDKFVTSIFGHGSDSKVNEKRPGVTNPIDAGIKPDSDTLNRIGKINHELTPKVDAEHEWFA